MIYLEVFVWCECLRGFEAVLFLFFVFCRYMCVSWILESLSGEGRRGLCGSFWYRLFRETFLFSRVLISCFSYLVLSGLVETLVLLKYIRYWRRFTSVSFVRFFRCFVYIWKYVFGSVVLVCRGVGFKGEMCFSNKV